MELIYQIFEDFSPGEVTPFAQTSQGALVLSLSFVDLEEMFKEACEENIKQAMLLMRSAILRAAQDDPEIGYNALAQACKGRHIETVRLLVSDGVRIEWPVSLGLTRKADFYNTPLGCAMRDSDPEMLNLLLEAGANIDGYKPLFRAQCTIYTTTKLVAPCINPWVYQLDPYTLGTRRGRQSARSTRHNSTATGRRVGPYQDS